MDKKKKETHNYMTRGIPLVYVHQILYLNFKM